MPHFMIELIQYISLSNLPLDNKMSILRNMAIIYMITNDKQDIQWTTDPNPPENVLQYMFK